MSIYLEFPNNSSSTFLSQIGIENICLDNVIDNNNIEYTDYEL